MSETPAGKPYIVGDDEKVSKIMVYTSQTLFWGDVVVKDQLRVSTWMRTNVAPDFFRLYDARVIYPSPGDSPRPIGYSELYIPTNQVIAYHLMPPLTEPLDYDPTEPNRIMEPIRVLAGTSLIQGGLRISTQFTLGKYLEFTKELFIPLYDVEIVNQIMPSLGVMRVYYVLVRQNAVSFSIINS